MQRQAVLTILGALLILGLGLLVGCAKDATPPPKVENGAPETKLTYAPLEGDTTTFRVHFYWNGYDNDGEVVRFRFALDADADTIPSNRWPFTTAKDTILKFLVDPVKEIQVHKLKVAAEDNDANIDPTPAVRSFSAKTIPPTSQIEKGPAAFNPLVGPNFTFEWSGIDPDGGENGGRAPVDSFEYLLLLVGGIADKNTPPAHDPLPFYQERTYVDLINNSKSDSLVSPLGPQPPDPIGFPYRFGDWKWTGIHSLKNRFRNQTPGEYVFALRAVDAAGAREKDLDFVRNIRHFTVTNKNPGPLLTVCASVFTTCLSPTSGPEDAPRKEIQVFEGETISFSWSATAAAYGGEVVGYTYALDDTSTFPGLDLLRTGATYTRKDLPPGIHFLYVRAVDDGGLVTNARIPLKIVHPAFKDPGAQRSILYVDDSMSPGNTLNRIQSFPSDTEETDWWRQFLFIQAVPGIPVAEWDTYIIGQGDVLGRKPPQPEDLSIYTTVVWNVDFNNGASLEGATGLWKTLVGGAYSELSGYLRAGGTLILSGFLIGGNVVNPSTTLYTNYQRGICFTLEPGTLVYLRSYFPRIMMGLDGAVPNNQGLRTLGARDFIEAWPTADGLAMGFDSCAVDRGPTGSGAKWITYSGGDVNSNRAPGLPQVDGWIMARSFGCFENPSAEFRLEDNSKPIATVVYRYHGARTGANEEGAPSPREGLAVGLAVQAHDLGNQGGNTGTAGPITPGNSAGAIGRMVHLAFPFYFLKDPQAVSLMQAAFNYVNASPTLP